MRRLLPLLGLVCWTSLRAEDADWTRLTPPGFPGGQIATDRRHPNRIFMTSQVWPAPTIVLRSLDGGGTWLPSQTGLLQVHGFGVDAAAPSRIYIGGGGGILRSDDNGSTWGGVVVPWSTVSAIWVHPSRGDAIYAVAKPILVGYPPELLYTADGGFHWDPRSTSFGELSISSSDPDVVYTTAQGRVVKSTDGLKTYSDASTGLPDPGAVYLVVAPSDSAVVYGGAFQEGMLYRTSDGGASWHPTSRPPLGVGAIAVDPSDPLRLVVGGRGGVSRSIDGGVTWSITTGLGSDPVGDLAIDTADPEGVLVATPSGLFRRSLGSSVCRNETEALCFGGRFRAEIVRRGPAGAEPGRAVPLTRDAGAFWFFTENNLEIVVKVVDGVTLNGRFWVFVAGLTDVEFDLQITDSATGSVWRRHNDAGILQSVADTNAFPGD